MASSVGTKLGRAAWFGALLTLSAMGPVLAQEAKPAEAKAPEAKAPEAKAGEAKPAEGNPWAVNCASGSTGTELQCQVSQNLTEAKTGQRVLTVTVRRDNGNGNLAMLLQDPSAAKAQSGG